MRRSPTVVLLVLAMGLAGGCAKRAWVAHRGAVAAYAEASPSVVNAVPVDAAWPDTPSAITVPAVPPAEDPVRDGAVALPPPGMLVAAELPWQEDSAPPSRVAPPDECRLGPCHWIQVAAPIDSMGCGALLQRAVTAAALPGGTPPAGLVRPEGGAWKIQLGPYVRWEEAEAVRDRLRAGGFPDAWLVRR